MLYKVFVYSNGLWFQASLFLHRSLQYSLLGVVGLHFSWPDVRNVRNKKKCRVLPVTQESSLSAVAQNAN